MKKKNKIDMTFVHTGKSSGKLLTLDPKYLEIIEAIVKTNSDCIDLISDLIRPQWIHLENRDEKV